MNDPWEERTTGSVWMNPGNVVLYVVLDISWARITDGTRRASEMRILSVGPTSCWISIINVSSDKSFFLSDVRIG